jgi:hypothetical protein
LIRADVLLHAAIWVARSPVPSASTRSANSSSSKFISTNAEIDPAGDQLLDAIVKGTHSGAVITEEALTRVGLSALREAVEQQPPWSDFPFVVLARRAQQTRGDLQHVEQALNVTVLERPLHPTSLVSAVRSAIRGRVRQRLAARHLKDLEEARAQLRALADSLETKVRDRTRDLASANDRLTALENTIQQNATNTLNQLRDIFNGVADKMSGAADTQQTAADTQLTAARTPRKIIIANSSGTEVGTFSG